MRANKLPHPPQIRALVMAYLFPETWRSVVAVDPFKNFGLFSLRYLVPENSHHPPFVYLFFFFLQIDGGGTIVCSCVNGRRCRSVWRLLATAHLK